MRPWSLLAGVNGALAIGLAAYGAHGVDPQAVPLMEKASAFQLIHAVALLALEARGLNGDRWSMVAGVLFVAGMLLFSGSLYVKALSGPLPLPMVTPAGGVAFLLGWGAVAVSACVRRASPSFDSRQ
ncbi:DUF423 domain-containing protein [Paramagnetospirillum marisnigri]|nr:DUF423 domain-containing protein [Paramagnetospirillum marisnigri]